MKYMKDFGKSKAASSHSEEMGVMRCDVKKNGDHHTRWPHTLLPAISRNTLLTKNYRTSCLPAHISGRAGWMI